MSKAGVIFFFLGNVVYFPPYWFRLLVFKNRVETISSTSTPEDHAVDMTFAQPAVILIMFFQGNAGIWGFVPLTGAGHPFFESKNPLKDNFIWNKPNRLEIHRDELRVAFHLSLDTLVVLGREVLCHFCNQILNLYISRNVLIRSASYAPNQEFKIFSVHSWVAWKMDAQDATSPPEARSDFADDKTAKACGCYIHMKQILIVLNHLAEWVKRCLLIFGCGLDIWKIVPSQIYVLQASISRQSLKKSFESPRRKTVPADV